MRSMSTLEALDLSFNRLIGKIPVELASLTFLAVLNLSHIHLVGPIPQSNQFKVIPISETLNCVDFHCQMNVGSIRVHQYQYHRLNNKKMSQVFLAK
ncbi:hypothetical protein KY289_002728 [Solanum tuberosum]|nr:hypothetical protein KY289_002728 [Solanum tuberosum]